MKKIGIIEIYSKRYGGIVYTQQVKEVLSEEFDFESVNLEAKVFKKRRHLKFLESFYYILKLSGEKDLWIRDFYSTLLMSKKKTKGKNLAIAFHIDFLKMPLFGGIHHFLAEKLFFYRQLKRIDAVVTISETWKNYFLKKGCKNVYKIYCGFDLDNFNIAEEEVSAFKKRYNLEGKPIIYLGNCQRVKGVVDAYKRLKDLNVHLVTSGRRQVKIPAINLDLEYRDYLKLLKASSVAITMSKFKEGWCMTAHEAMLCKTPVIGSGLGGMRELLEGGKQIICEDFDKLQEKVEFLLKNPKERNIAIENGYNFAKDFTKERFKKEWVDLVKRI